MVSENIGYMCYISTSSNGKKIRAVFLNIILLKPDVLAYISYPSTYEVNAVWLQWVWLLLGICSEFQDRLGYSLKLYQRQEKGETNKV